MRCAHRYGSHLLFITGISLAAGCPDRSISQVNPTQQGAVTKEIPVSADIDVLFVIDNSASTADKQTIFANNFPKFVAALDAFPTGRPNLHIGVVDSTIDLGTTKYNTQGCPSPDPNDNGVLQNTARVTGCTPPTGRFISDIKNTDGTRTTNYTGTLDVALGCIAQVGASGCGFEAQLEAMKRALDGSRPENAGFIRPGAYLAVIFLTDEDDASTTGSGANPPGPAVFGLADGTVGGANDFRVQPMFAYNCDKQITTSPDTYMNCVPRTDSYLQDPAFYSQFLAGAKDPARTVVAVIAAQPPGLTTNDVPGLTAGAGTGTYAQITTGPLPLNGTTQAIALLPSCAATINGNPAIGRPAVRLASFLSSYADRGKFYSICQGDYSAALTDIGKTLFNAISPCLEGSLDTSDADPNNPGTQLQCTVTDVVDSGTTTTTTAIPNCKMTSATTPDPGGARPCWWVDQSAANCPAPDTGYEINIERTAPPAVGTTVDVECAVAAGSGA